MPPGAPTGARQRAGVAGAFFVQGLLLISLTTRLPAIQSRFELSELQISGVMLLVVGLAGAGSVLAELVAARATSEGALRCGLLIIAAAMAVVAFGPRWRRSSPGSGCMGSGVGMVDAASNMQGISIEHLLRRSVTPSLFAGWTLGGIVATVVAMPLAESGLPTSLGWAPVVALAAATLPLVRHTHDPVAEQAADIMASAGPAAAMTARDSGTATSARSTPVADLTIPWRRLLLVGLAMVLFYKVDTAATTWGPRYLHSTLESTAALAPLATHPALPRRQPARPHARRAHRGPDRADPSHPARGSRLCRRPRRHRHCAELAAGRRRLPRPRHRHRRHRAALLLGGRRHRRRGAGADPRAGARAPMSSSPASTSSTTPGRSSARS